MPTCRLPTRALAARNKLVKANTRLIFHMINHLRRRWPRASELLSRDELASEGAVGLLAAAERFDPARGYKFSTLACLCIRQAMERAILQERTRRARLRVIDLPEDGDLAGLVVSPPDPAELGDVVPLDALTDRQRRAIDLRFFEGATFAQLGQALGDVSGERGRQILAGGLRKLREAMGGRDG